MHDRSFVPFTEDMKKDYTILVPNMLPMHFRMVLNVAKTYGYNMELLETSGSEIVEAGLKYTHNDACYPAILVVGQFMHALESGKYDLNKTALIMFQTGGGCRASNYISLIRKALAKAGWQHIPVISFSLAGLEKHPGFRLGLPMLRGMMYGVMYGDLLMNLVNQVRPYEKNPGDAEALCTKWSTRLAKELGSGGHIHYRQIRNNFRRIAGEFREIPVVHRETVRVGIVGEIFVKYSPLANNNLEQFLISEGAEVVTPGLLDFCLYVVWNNLTEKRVYGRKKRLYPFMQLAYRFLNQKRTDISSALRQEHFIPLTPFEEVIGLAGEYINTCVMMGEGWLLTAEMLELAGSGVKNIVCTQPFGCLPNHICGKGMMKPIKEHNPDINIVAIDYDPGASRVNQENRLKLMLANARNTPQG